MNFLKSRSLRVVLFLVFALSVAVMVQAGEKSPAGISNFFHVFSDALQIVNDRYLREVNPRDLVYGAIQGMLRVLDPDSEFLTPEEFARLRAETEGEFVGIGAKVSIQDDGLRIVNVLEDSPAARAGLKAGDRIVNVDGKSLNQIPHDEMLQLLKGRTGSVVDVGILAESGEGMATYKLGRTLVDIPNIKDAKLMTARVGYVRIVEFGEKTRLDLRNALEQLREQGATRFVIDVRDNPGGTLEAAYQVTELFLSRGDLIVSTVGRRTDESFEIEAKETGPYSAAPLAVLINKDSASASEVLAGALQDHGRAKLFGTNSFGKASVQALLTLRDGSAIRITTAEYFTPKRSAINHVGLKPDYLVEDDSAQLTEAVSYLENLALA